MSTSINNYENEAYINGNASNDGNSLPQNAKAIALILHTLGVTDAEPRVIQQFLDLMNRYVVDVLSDASTYADHAGKQNIIDKDDVRLAIHNRTQFSFVGPPSREVLAEVVQEKNSIPLPMIDEKYGVRLPPEEHCLIRPNYKMVSEKIDQIKS